MTAREFLGIYRELIDENPLAVRAVLKILAIEFSAAVPTLAVTCTDRPRLLVNLDFVTAHCRTDAEVKAVICHEFLHVLLRHTERTTPVTLAEHIALDAVINAIIHRTLGPASSAMMSRYYADVSGPALLLRPRSGEVKLNNRVLRGDANRHARLLAAWDALYQGKLVADAIRDLALDLLPDHSCVRARLIGNHDGAGPDARALDGTLTPAKEALARALDDALKAMNGSGIFRSPNSRGVGAVAYREQIRGVDAALARWRRQTYEVLRAHLLPDRRSSAREPSEVRFTLPVLSSSDRRAALRTTWSPFLPDAQWTATHLARTGTAQVYLDVSGSMHAEMGLIVALLGRLGRYIRRPFWAFSDVVAPARIEGGHLVTDTTGGTSLTCVLDHIARTRPEAAVVVTDGYVEPIDRAQVRAVAGTRLHVILTRDGSAATLQAAGLPCTQLAKVPG